MSNLIRKMRVGIYKKRKLKWNYTDTILHIRDKIEFSGMHPENIFGRDTGKEFICLKDYNSNTIFVPKNMMEVFINDKRFYNKKKDWANITNIKKFLSTKNTIARIINSAPKEIEIRRTMVCTIRDSNEFPYNIYFVSKIDIDKNDDIFNELLNLQIMKEKFSLK